MAMRGGKTESPQWNWIYAGTLVAPFESQFLRTIEGVIEMRNSRFPFQGICLVVHLDEFEIVRKSFELNRIFDVADDIRRQEHFLSRRIAQA